MTEKEKEELEECEKANDILYEMNDALTDLADRCEDNDRLEWLVNALDDLNYRVHKAWQKGYKELRELEKKLED